MKFLKYCCITILLFQQPINALGSSSSETVIFDATISILKELKSMDLLNGKTIAVFGFHDAVSGKGCRPLTIFLANKIDSNINKIKGLLGVDFRTVPRHALDSIETEYVISMDGSHRDIFSLIKSSDILITGMWQDHGASLNLTIKAIGMKDHDIDELTAHSKNIDKASIPMNLLSCLGDYVVRRGPVERIGPGEMDWGPKMLRVKGFGIPNKHLPKYAWRKSAEEAAIADAQAKLVEMVDGFNLESKIFVKNYQVIMDTKIKEIKGKLRYVEKIGKTVYTKDDTAEVVLQVNLSDVF